MSSNTADPAFNHGGHLQRRAFAGIGHLQTPRHYSGRLQTPMISERFETPNLLRRSQRFILTLEKISLAGLDKNVN
jgi:hypothetical protein